MIIIDSFKKKISGRFKKVLLSHLKKEILETVYALEKAALETKNPWDDIAVMVLKEIVGELLKITDEKE